MAYEGSIPKKIDIPENAGLPKLPKEFESNFMENFLDNREILSYDPENCTYKNSYIAYLDILGYKNLIKTLGDKAPQHIF